MRPRLIAVEDELAEMVIGNTWTLQGGHGGSPWMTERTGRKLDATMRLQGGHGGSPWMTTHPGQAIVRSAGRFNEATADRRGGRLLIYQHQKPQPDASMRPRLIAVDDAGRPVFRSNPRKASMRPRLIAVDDPATSCARSATRTGLQGGHGGSPWMTPEIELDAIVATLLQGGHGGSPWMTRRRTGPSASEKRFNEATADRRGGRRQDRRQPLRLRASMRPRLIAVDDPGTRGPTSAGGSLQGGHGGSPWMTMESGGGFAPLARFNEATADRRGGRESSFSRRPVWLELQGGHGGSPWMTQGRRPRPHAGLRASMRPRLIAVDDEVLELLGFDADVASMRPRLIAVDDDFHRL